MTLGNIGTLKQIVAIISFSAAAIFCLFMTSNEVTLGNSTPLDISTATVEQIQSNTLIDVKINATIGAFATKSGSNEDYYLIPMGNGKFIIFVTGDAAQKRELDNFIYTYDGTNGTLDLDVKGRIYNLTADEERVFFRSIVEAGIGLDSVAEAKQYIVPYKIVNYQSSSVWIFAAISVICLLFVAFMILSMVKQSRQRKAYTNPVQYQNTVSNENPNAYNPYAQEEYYTCYEDSQQSNTQANDNQSNINRF